VPSYGFVAHKDDTKEIIVSWRGSTILMDWIADLTFVPVPWPKQVDGSAVHVGFLSAYSAAADKIKSVVAGLVQKYPDYKIVLTGHSLGGAEAAVGAADFAVTHPEWVSKMELYTYGEPRVGNPSFAAWMSKQPFPIYRVVNKGDLVPQVPLQVMGFEQHSQEVWYTPSGKTQFCGSDGENKACQDSLGPLQLSILDHLGYPGL
ncbi:alpha/beta-hydrolase, partial [Martensiomyces pterosporus]